MVSKRVFVKAELGLGYNRTRATHCGNIGEVNQYILRLFQLGRVMLAVRGMYIRFLNKLQMMTPRFTNGFKTSKALFVAV